MRNVQCLAARPVCGYLKRRHGEGTPPLRPFDCPTHGFARLYRGLAKWLRVRLPPSNSHSNATSANRKSRSHPPLLCLEFAQNFTACRCHPPCMLLRGANAPESTPIAPPANTAPSAP
ncbi:hypothetical protein BJV78DRAFT_1244559 [Lactifluus subvellereus]|nr:hypothetical protein BJV78DRAFT_1244559 [Lactifluus subvellereus]